MKEVREKTHRLNKSIYIGNVTACFTICIENRYNLFEDEKIVAVFEDILRVTCENYGFELNIYLFMPDHLHFMLQGKSDDSDCLKAVNMFKQKTGFWLSQNTAGVKWQKDYFDHIIWKEKDIQNQFYYILNNPVRAGFVSAWKDYKHKGSTIYDLDTME